eukprot:7059468-Pyramimonas_sp.AAC.1
MTMALGGLQSLADLGDVSRWADNKLWGRCGPRPEGVYVAGEFHGIAFVKFASNGGRDEAVYCFVGPVSKKRVIPRGRSLAKTFPAARCSSLRLAQRHNVLLLTMGGARRRPSWQTRKETGCG